MLLSGLSRSIGLVLEPHGTSRYLFYVSPLPIETFLVLELDRASFQVFHLVSIGLLKPYCSGPGILFNIARIATHLYLRGASTTDCL